MNITNETTDDAIIPLKAYLWIDRDTAEVTYSYEPINRKSETNSLGGYIPYKEGTPEEIYKEYLKLKKNPKRVMKYIKTLE